MSTTIYFVRHAAAENPENIEYGRMPGFKLSEKGKQQAKKIGEFLKDKKINVILTSPLERAFETANIVSDVTGSKIVHSFNLNEVESSLWQGTKIEELFKNDSYENFINNPEAKLPTENLTTLSERMHSVVEQILDQNKNENVVCVSHEFPILALKLKLENRPLQSLKTYNFPFGSILELVYDEKNFLTSIKVYSTV